MSAELFIIIISSSSSSRNEYYLGGIITLLLQNDRTMSTESELLRDLSLTSLCARLFSFLFSRLGIQRIRDDSFVV